MLAESAERLLQVFVQGILCTMLLVPAEIHGTFAEVGAHDVQGAVSVDARHAGQAAHFEHSMIEIHSRCATCLLTSKFNGLPRLPRAQADLLPRSGTVPVFDPQAPFLELDRHSAGRSPPHLSSL